MANKPDKDPQLAQPIEPVAAPEANPEPVMAQAPAEPADPDDGVLYRIGAPWSGFTRYECLTAPCQWDSLDRDAAIDHYIYGHPAPKGPATAAPPMVDPTAGPEEE